MARIRTLRASRYLTLLMGGVIALAMAVTALPHDPYVRWQSFNGTMFERTAHFYERLHYDPTPVDVVFIGSSRTAIGVNPAMLQDDLDERGLNLDVVNLSLPASGMDVRLVEAREALAAHPETQLLVISVVEALPRDGHQAFGDLATTEEILSAPILTNRNLPENLLRLPMRQMKLAAATALPEAFGVRRTFSAADYAGTLTNGGELAGWAPQEPNHPYDSEAHEHELAAESAFRKADMTPPILPENLAWIEFGVSRSSIEEIVELARANNTQIAFLFIPFFEGYHEPAELDWLEQYGPVWRTDFIRLDPRNYRDAAHASPRAEPLISAWLAERIASDFPNLTTQSEEADD